MPDASVALRLVAALNAMAAGAISAPEAEARLRFDGRPHHVLDADAQFGAEATTVTLRRALAWVDRVRTPWALLLPVPGNPGGLRGPSALNAAALDRGAVVVRHDGGPAWLCDEVGHGVQWTLLRAERPAPPDDPRSAGRTLAAVMTDAAAALRGLEGGFEAGFEVGRERPDTEAPRLGRAYPAGSQALLDRAWLLLAASELGATAAATTSHAALQREHALRPLARAARDAISSAASWPSFAMVE